MTLRRRLLLAQAPLAIAVAFLGVVSVRTLQTIGASSENILKDNYRSVLAAQRMKESIERVDSAALFFIAGHPELARPQALVNRARFEDELEGQEKNITEPGEAEATRRMRALWSQYSGNFDRFVRLPSQEEQRTSYFATLGPLFEQVKGAADVILSINQDAMVHKSDVAKKTTARMTTLLMFAAVGTLLLGVAGTTSLTSRLLRPLFALSDAARRIGEGDLEARALVLGRDEIADLSREFNTMASRLAQYRRSSLGELLQAQQSSQAAIDSLPDPVVLFGSLGEVLSANRAAGELFGIELELAAGDPLQKAPPPIREALEHVRAHVLGGRGAYSPRGFEDAVRVPSSQGDRCFLPRGSPVYAEEGGVAGAAVVLQDVTRLLFFDQFKTDVVATVAHEFRTPLTSLRMAIHLCLEGAAGSLTEKQADLLQAGREDCERLQDIVDDLLDASRIQAGRLELHRARLRARTILDQANAFRASADQRHIRLEVLDETSEEDELSADADRLELVMTNLVQNALRHTPPQGTVRISASTRDRTIRFEITDTGPGIPAAYQQRIFEKYFQVPGGAPGGAGLGLYISREIVLAHGGEMGVTSEPDRGSTFWFTLPRAGGEAAPDQA